MNPEQIVRLLAAAPQPYDGQYGCCPLCYGGFDDHGGSCPWKLAVQWARDHAEVPA